MTEAIKVEGLREFSRRLRAMDRDLPKGLRIALNAAAQTVVDEASPRVPRRTGRAADSLKPKSTRTLARVSGGSSRAPYYPWLDFGGRVGRRNSVARPYRRDGRYLYPAYRRLRASGAFEDALSEALAEIANKAGIEVDSGG